MQKAPEKYAAGGEVDQDQEDLMDGVAMEGINAFHNKDHAAFRDSFHTLVAHTLNKLGSADNEKED